MFVLLSLFASIIQELISSLISLRGKVLITALARFIGFETPKERFVFMIYLKTVNQSYKKLMSSSLWIKRYPSYLSKDHLIAIIQDLYKAKQELENQTKCETTKVVDTGILKDNIKLLNPFENDVIRRKIEKYDPNPNLNSEALNRYFWWKSLSFEIFEPIGRFLERRVRNQALVADNLGWYENKLKLKSISDDAISRNISIVTAEFSHDRSSSDIEIEVAKNELYRSYEDYMGRARGWFKRKVQLYLILIGFVIAFITNADTIATFNHLSSDPIARENAVRIAESYLNSNQFKNFNDEQDSIKQLGLDSERIKALNASLVDLVDSQINPSSGYLGIGWDESIIESSLDDDKNFRPSLFIYHAGGHAWDNPNKFLGFFITALAISLGANFWFDLLVLLVNIRNTGKRPEVGSDTNQIPAHGHSGPVVSQKGTFSTISNNKIVG